MNLVRPPYAAPSRMSGSSTEDKRPGDAISSKLPGRRA
jgi:hypothetical protein